ncbi:MAG: chromosome segregation protein SMC, partial [Deltaproteobacteria bacterium]|nr:chromosome segregation protein SMC [Deltaproteobacteria bacterium]
KKEASLKKLEATRQNLTRVSDIISEVKRQLNSLNRQAKKAERYGVIKDELTKLDLYLSHTEFQRMAGELAEHTKTLANINDEEVSLQAKANALEATTEDKNLDYLKKEEEFKGMREKSFAVERKIQEAERSMELALLRVEEINRSSDRLSNEINELKGQAISTEDDLGRLQGDINTAQTTLDTERGNLATKEEELNTLSSELGEKEAALRISEARSLEDTTRLSEIKHTLQSCLREEDGLREKLAQERKQKEETQSRFNEKQAPLEKLKDSLSETLNSKEKLEANLAQAKENLSGLEAEDIKNSEKLKELQEELTAKGARLKTLKEMERNFDGIKDGAKTILQHGNLSDGGSYQGSNSSTMEGIHGLVADVIETAPGCEKAIEAVLGDRLQCVIVESQKEGVEAIEYLKTHASGRGSFVPVIDPRHPELFESEALEATFSTRPAPEGTRRLLDEVTVKSCYRPVMNQLLGDVLLVDDFTSAMTIWMRNGISDTLVTPEGEMIDASGVITGGYSNGAGGGLLVKKKEIKELGDLIETIELNHNLVKEDIESNTLKITEAKVHLEDSTKKLHAEDLERVNREGELKIISEETVRLDEKISELDRNITRNEETTRELEGKKSSLATERTELESEIKEIEELVIRGRLGVTALRERKDVISSEATEIKVSLASAKERYDHTGSQITSKEDTLKNLTNRSLQKTEEIAGGTTERGEKEGLASEHKSNLDELLISMETLKREDVLKEEALSELSKNLKTSEAEVKEFKKGIEVISSKKAELSLNSREIELAIGNLKEKTIEKYGMGIDNYVPSEEVLALETEAVSTRVNELREKVGKMGEVSLSALEEFNELSGRMDFLLEQQEDLLRSVDSIQGAITRINKTTREKFQETFEAINEEFKKNFPRFFSGGKAELKLAGEGDVLERGVEIVAQPPGKRQQNITLLSGGEKALTATALIFSIFLVKPSPFCLLDEVDAPLDDANIDRFNGFVREMSEKSQFILITHNKRSMEMVDTLFGITMEEPGVSKTVSVKL